MTNSSENLVAELKKEILKKAAIYKDEEKEKKKNKKYTSKFNLTIVERYNFKTVEE